MKKSNKLITLIITLTMVFSMSAFSVFADNEFSQDTNKTTAESGSPEAGSTDEQTLFGEKSGDKDEAGYAGMSNAKGIPEAEENEISQNMKLFNTGNSSSKLSIGGKDLPADSSWNYTASESVIPALKSGKVSYDGNGKLTLENANIKVTGDVKGIEACGIDLTIELLGENKISSENEGINYDCGSGDTGISFAIIGASAGKLTVEANESGIASSVSDCFTIANATVDVISKNSIGIRANGKTVIENASVKAVGYTGGIAPLEDYGSKYGDYEIKNSTVIAESTATESGPSLEYHFAGIYNYRHTVDISNSYVTATGNSHGVCTNSGNVVIKDSIITATGDRAINASGGNVRSTDSKVIATGNDCGIFVMDGDVEIDGGTIETSATGTSDHSYTSGIFVNYGAVKIKNGKVNSMGGVAGIMTVSGQIEISGGIIDSTGGSYGIAAEGVWNSTDEVINIKGASTRVTAKSEGKKPAGYISYNMPLDSAAIVAYKNSTNEQKDNKFISINYNDGLSILVPEAGIVDAGSKRISIDFEYYTNYTDIADRNKNVALTAVIAPAVSSEPLMATVKAKGKRAVNVTWNALSNADGYDVFFARCNTKKKKYTCTYAGSVNGSNSTSWTKTDLNKRTPYKVYVMAYTLRGGEKTYIAKSPTVHAYTGGYSSKYTNPKSVKVKKTKVSVKAGKTYKIRASVRKLKKGRRLINSAHAPKLRYLSTNTSIATVTKYGKIKGKSAGTCKVYVYAVNGVKKVVNVTVK